MIRRPTLVAASLALAGCATSPPPTAADQQARLAEALSGRVAGQAVKCLPPNRSAGVDAIGATLLFRDGGRLWLNRSRGGGCEALNAPHYTLVTRSFGSGRLCSGDIAQVVDLTSGAFAGSCALGDFVPYTRT
jgi:hypothetical protein